MMRRHPPQPLAASVHFEAPFGLIGTGLFHVEEVGGLLPLFVKVPPSTVEQVRESVRRQIVQFVLEQVCGRRGTFRQAIKGSK